MRQASKPPSQRQLRVGETVRHALSGILMRGVSQEPELSRPITVTEVRCSPDLRHATVFFSLLGQEEEQAPLATVQQALKRSAKWLRGQLAGQLTMKYLPELHFEPDMRFAEAARIDRLLRDARDMEEAEPMWGTEEAEPVRSPDGSAIAPDTDFTPDEER